ncbi:MAG TPA: tryptophan--tRNA ligase [Candidatus Methylacidiphilales bacterium]|nr:tryptophan--tRNA ligase [Candidatus Methylacidiphilales bacterium]
MKIILTGIQPSGALHLGNYFGAIQPAVQMQEQGQAVYFIADYHALTSVAKADELRRYVFEVAAGFLACGIDPARTILFRQSDVPQVHELAWLLSVVTPMGLLERAHSYKDKIAQGAEASHGLFAYPVLMAADILLYGSDLVPVGKDQKQHLEIARDIAQKFNDRFGPVFKLPEPVIREATAIVPGIDGRKMSKSYGNTIPLFGDEKEIKKPVMGITTDSTPMDQPKQIEGTTIGQLMQAVNPAAYKDYAAQAAMPGVGYGDLKKKLLAEITVRFAPFQEKFQHYQAHPGEVEAVLRDGAARARELAAPVLAAARKATGLSK